MGRVSVNTTAFAAKPLNKDGKRCRGERRHHRTPLGEWRSKERHFKTPLCGAVKSLALFFGWELRLEPSSIGPMSICEHPLMDSTAFSPLHALPTILARAGSCQEGTSGNDEAEERAVACGKSLSILRPHGPETVRYSAALQIA